MKYNLRRILCTTVLLAALMVLLVPSAAFADVQGDMTSHAFENKAQGGVITLTGDVRITDKLSFSSDARVDLNGYTLKLSKGNNYITGTNKVTISNGTIDIRNLTEDAGQGVVIIGTSGNNGTLKLNKVTVNVEGVNSGAGTIHLYAGSTFEMLDSSLNVKDEIGGLASAIYCNDPQGVVRIGHSKVSVVNGRTGIYYGRVTIENGSKIDLKTRDNAINAHGSDPASGNKELIVDNSEINMSSLSGGRGLTLSGKSVVHFKNGAKMVSSNFPEGALMYKSDVDSTSKPLTIDEQSAVELVGETKFVDHGTKVPVAQFTTFINMSGAKPIVDGNGNLVLCKHGITSLRNKTDATCADEGYTGDKVCDLCDTTVEQGTKIPATGKHQYEWIIDREATDSAAGQKHEECTVCHQKKDPVVIPATVSSVDMPQTGDASRLGLYVILLVASAVGVFALGRRMKDCKR